MEWYGNARRIVPCTEKTASGSKANSKAVKHLLASNPRRKQHSHVFSALFYNSLVKPHVDYKAYKDLLGPGTEPMSEFVYRNTCTREAWEKAPPDIVQQVIEHKALMEMTLEELENLSRDTGSPGGSGTVVASSMDKPDKSHTLGTSEVAAPALEMRLEGEEELGDDPKKLEGAIAMGDQAASFYKSAISEMLQMKKVDEREK